MNRFNLLGILFLIAANHCIFAQDLPTTEVTHEGGQMMQGFRRRALVIDIDARVLDPQQEVIWNETHHKLAMPGSPVGVKMVGSNVVVTVQFTPFIRRHGQNVLVAQGQIWVNDPDKGMSYYTLIQTIPLEFGEPVYFFPLGSSQQLDSLIEMIITVNLNSAGVRTEEAAETEDDR